MQLKELPLVALHWHAACILSGGLLCHEQGGVPMKFKLIAALLGLMIAIPVAISAQNPDDQAPDRFRC